MATEYLEVNSGYRNRNQWPLASDFDVFFSQSGVKDRFTAVDPVCNAAPRIIFTPFKPITGTIVEYPTGAYPNDTGVGAGSAGTHVFVKIPSTQYTSREPNYYAGAVLVINRGTVQVPQLEYYRIAETIFYLVGPINTPQTSDLDTYDYFLFVLYDTCESALRHQTDLDTEQNRFVKDISFTYTFRTRIALNYTWVPKLPSFASA